MSENRNVGKMEYRKDGKTDTNHIRSKYLRKLFDNAIQDLSSNQSRLSGRMTDIEIEIFKKEMIQASRKTASNYFT